MWNWKWSELSKNESFSRRSRGCIGLAWVVFLPPPALFLFQNAATAKLRESLSVWCCGGLPTQKNNKNDTSKQASRHTFYSIITLHHYLFIVELFSIPFKRKRLQRDCCDLRDVWDFSGLLTLNFVDWILKRIDFPSCLIWLIPFVVCDKKFWIPSFLGRISSFNQKANLLTDLWCVSPFKVKKKKKTIHTKMNMALDEFDLAWRRRY